MPDWPLMGGGVVHEASGAEAFSNTHKIISSATANTKGAYVELIAATLEITTTLEVAVRTNSTSSSLLDISVGASSSEQVIIANILTAARASQQDFRFFLPLFIPKGERISARVQSTGTSQEIHCGISVSGGPFMPSAPLGRMTTYGATTSDSGGISVDPGSTGSTKGAYSQIVSSTTNNIKLLWVMFGNLNNQAMGNDRFLFDIAVGSATSETIIIPDIATSVTANSDGPLNPVAGPYPVRVPAGSRLAARSQSDATDATDRLLDVIIYGAD